MELLKRWIEKQTALSAAKREIQKLGDQLSRTERDLLTIEQSVKTGLKDGYYQVEGTFILIKAGQPEILEVNK